MAPSYKLIYFDARGVAEPIRWIFAQGGVKYEDYRINKPDWPTLKSTTPFGQVPVLEVDGKPLPQSVTIARYVARVNKLAGKDDWEAAQADAIVDYVQDAVKPLAALYSETDEKKKSTIKELFVKEGVQSYLQGLERKLRENPSGQEYLVGNAVTWADLYVEVALDRVLAMDISVLDKYPLLKAHNARIHELKGIKEWLLKRPITEN